MTTPLTERLKRAQSEYLGLFAEAQAEIERLRLDREVAVNFIKRVYEAVHCKAAPETVNLLRLADETVSEIERWKVLAPPV